MKFHSYNLIQNQFGKKKKAKFMTYSGIPSGGNTIDNILSINLYFNIRSLTVVDVNDGEEFTSTNHGFKLLSIIIS